MGKVKTDTDPRMFVSNPDEERQDLSTDEKFSVFTFVVSALQESLISMCYCVSTQRVCVFYASLR